MQDELDMFPMKVCKDESLDHVLTFRCTWADAKFILPSLNGIMMFFFTFQHLHFMITLCASFAAVQSGRGSSSQALVTLSPQPQAQPQQLQQPQGQQAQASSNSRGSSWSSQGNAGQPTTNRTGAGRGGRGGNYQVGGRGGSYLYNGGPAVRMGDPSFSPSIPAVGPG